MHNFNVTVGGKFSAVRATRWLLLHSDRARFNFGRGAVPDPAGRAYDGPQIL